MEDELQDGHSIYAPGAPVPVHYNPATPNRSVVEPAFHWSHLGWALVGLALAAGGIWSAWNECFGFAGLWPLAHRRLLRRR